MVLDYVFVQEEAVGGVVAWLRASYHHLRQPEEGLRRAGQVSGEDGGKSLQTGPVVPKVL